MLILSAVSSIGKASRMDPIVIDDGEVISVHKRPRNDDGEVGSTSQVNVKEEMGETKNMIASNCNLTVLH